MRQQRRAIRRHPTRSIVLAYLVLIAVGAALLSLPWARDDRGFGITDSVFTATSAVTVTGLTVVDASTWTLFGQIVLVVLVQLGGFGIMTLGAVFVLVASQRMGVRQRMLAQTEIGSDWVGDIRVLVRTIALVTITIEGVVATVLALRFWASGLESPLGAIGSGIFHAVMAFNNAGMSVYDGNFTVFAADPTVLLAVSMAIVLGGLGFPVILELAKEQRPKRWTLHTKITLAATGLLLVLGPVLITAFEWTNAKTLGSLPTWEKALNGVFQGVSPRTAGFNSIDIGGTREATTLVMIALMFIGAGAASTGGGIRVTTFAVVGWVAWNEVRGNRETAMFRRRIPSVTVGQALVVIVLSIGLIFATTLTVLMLEPVSGVDAAFESVSAFGTVGLSRGITGELGLPSRLLLAVVMLAGRVGPSTLAAAVISRERPQLYRYPEERPIIG